MKEYIVMALVSSSKEDENSKYQIKCLFDFKEYHNRHKCGVAEEGDGSDSKLMALLLGFFIFSLLIEAEERKLDRRTDCGSMRKRSREIWQFNGSGINKWDLGSSALLSRAKLFAAT